MLSKKTKYAINALVMLARQYEKGPIHIREIAVSENIPQKFLEAILNDLKHAGILASAKGRNGGYFLKKSPKDVSLASVLRLFDGAIGFLPCVTYLYYEECAECKDEKVCPIRDVFKEVRDETVGILKKSTLSQLLARERKLKKRKKA